MVRSDSEPLGPFVQLDETLVGRIAARLIESLLAKPQLTMRSIVDQTMPFRRLQSPGVRG